MSENIEPAVEESRGESQVENLAQQFIEALHDLEEGDDSEADKLSLLFAKEAVLANSATESAGDKIQGREAIHRFWVEYKGMLGQANSKFHHVTTSSNAAGLFWTTETEGSDTRYHGATLLQFNEEGLISFFRGYYDSREL